MKRTAFGLSAMTLSLLFGWIIAFGSLLATRGQLDTKVLANQPFNLPNYIGQLPGSDVAPVGSPAKG